MILLRGVTDGGACQHMATDRDHAQTIMAALDAISAKVVAWTMEETHETEIVAATMPEHRNPGMVSGVTDSTTEGNR